MARRVTLSSALKCAQSMVNRLNKAAHYYDYKRLDGVHVSSDFCVHVQGYANRVAVFSKPVAMRFEDVVSGTVAPIVFFYYDEVDLNLDVKELK